jgi:hypothetical protein
MPMASLYGGIRNSGKIVGVDVTGVTLDCAGRSVLFVSGLHGVGVGAASNLEPRCLQRHLKLLACLAASVEPIGGLDAMKPPTHIFKDFLTQPVPLSCPKADVIGRSVALDGKSI